MNKLTILTLTLISLVLGAMSAQAETLSATSTAGAPGQTVTVAIILDDNNSGVAGTTFTLNYDTANLDLVEVRSDFFPLFSSQNIAPTTIEIDGVIYDSALVICPAGEKFAAARVDNGPLGQQTIFELDFVINESAPVGTAFPIQIQQTQIQNPEAGYEELTPIPFLIGIDGTSYPERTLSAPATAGSIAVEEGTSFVDQDSDGIDDNWEIEHFGNTTTANATSDYDQDGYTDLVEYNNSVAGSNDPLGNTFVPTFKNVPGGLGYNSSTDRRAPQDFNSDATSDILTRNTGNGLTYIYNVVGSRITSFNPIATFPAASWEFAGIGDFNGDGTADILARNTDKGWTYIYNVAGSKITSYNYIATFTTASWEFAGIGDFNGDGTTDILIRNTDDSRTYICNVADSTIISYSPIATFPAASWEFAGIGDFNDDGTADILARNTDKGWTYIYNVAGSKITSYNYIATFTAASWELAGIGDFSGDGTADILARNTDNGLTYIYNVAGSKVTSYSPIATFPAATWEFAGIGNFDGDGSSDILARNIDKGWTYIYNVAGSKITSYNYIATFSTDWAFE